MRPDTELLDLMVRDWAEAEPQWQATAYWREIVDPLIEYFRDPEHVVHFRRAPIRTGIRSSFPANPSRVPALSARGRAAASLLAATPLLGRVVEHYETAQKVLVDEHVSLFRHSLVLSWLLLRELYGGGGVLDDALEGDPDDSVVIEGRHYSYRSLGYQYLYCQAGRRIDFSTIGSVCELGSGYGGQAEILLRKNPSLGYAAVDILPWLYVAEIYLESLFPGEVLGYRETRKIDSPRRLREAMGGRRIAMVPAWKWRFVEDEFDLFWNSKSLQEMNENAASYLRMAAGRCRYLFLHAYGPSKKNVHTPQALRSMVEAEGSHSLLMEEKDLYAGKDSMSMLFGKS